MEIYRLDQNSQNAVRSLPETGMGFQIVESPSLLGAREVWLVLQHGLAIELTKDTDVE